MSFPGHWTQGLTFTWSNTRTESLSNLREYCCTRKHSHWPPPLPCLAAVLRLAVCFTQNQIWQVCRGRTVSLGLENTRLHYILIPFCKIRSFNFLTTINYTSGDYSTVCSHHDPQASPHWTDAIEQTHQSCVRSQHCIWQPLRTCQIKFYLEHTAGLTPCLFPQALTNTRRVE